MTSSKMRAHISQSVTGFFLMSPEAGPAELGPAARLVGLYESLDGALQAYGFDAGAGRKLIESATGAERVQVEFERAAGPDAPARRIVVRRMRGNHAEAWELQG